MGAFAYFRESMLSLVLVGAAVAISWLVVEGPVTAGPVPKLVINFAAVVVGIFALFLWWEIQNSSDENGPNFVVAAGGISSSPSSSASFFERKTLRAIFRRLSLCSRW